MINPFLYPRESRTRQVKDISGIWQFKIDKNTEGRRSDWKNGLADTVPMAVPSSFNDIFTEKELRDFAGDVWYETEFFIPAEWEKQNVEVRFGSATHSAVAWLNGTEICSHTGGYMPFSGRLNEVARFGEKNKLIVVVNNELSLQTIPCGKTEIKENGQKLITPFFDFFNYAGLHRNVKLTATPENRIHDITIKTDINGSTGIVDFEVETIGEHAVSVQLIDESGTIAVSAAGKKGILTVEDARLWQPGNAYLYSMVVSVNDGKQLVDEYSLPIGIRTVEVKGNRFLINGDPFYFKGFGKHEDSEYRGRGYDPVVNLRDLELLKWIGANSVRTSHYPYSEEFLDMADRAGLLVIDETPAVGLMDMDLNFLAGAGGAVKIDFFDKENVMTGTMANHKDAIRELLHRDKNHACVVMWCLANEPASQEKSAGPYFKEIFEYSGNLDVQKRPLTFTNLMLATFGKCNAHQYADVILLNRYYGWYMMGGSELPVAKEAFKKELAGWSTTGKPIVMAEYGADTMSGIHKLPSVMWSEEYQTEYLDAQHEVFDSCDSLVGEQMWNFADFQTVEGFFRVDGNKKGAFTRTRQPKAAAFQLKERWAGIPDFGYKK